MCASKLHALDDELLTLLQNGGLAVAFSGGVDSTFLLARAMKVAQAHRIEDRMLAITAHSAFFPEVESTFVQQFVEECAIKHIDVFIDVLGIPEVASNGSDRCYECKLRIFKSMIEAANSRDITNVVDGTNIDDLQDVRPGLKALRELGVISPLADAGLTKQDIRSVSKEMGLLTYDKPAMACLATRIPFGQELNAVILKRVEEAEDAIRQMGFPQARVRVSDGEGLSARIELPPADIHLMVQEQTRQLVLEQLKALGFCYVAVDLLGYRVGSMNETL